MKDIKFMDFCAGIGGGRIGLENLDMSCVGFSEIDKDAEITYKEFFGQDEKNYGDLMKINPDGLPDFDFMVGGFPCQTFSIIGTRCGLEDEKRGQVIYGLVKILKAKNVKYFILENVKGLINHDKGNTLKTVLELLDNAGYKVYHKILNSIDFGVPQMRERIYFVGVQKDLIDDNFSYEFPQLSNTKIGIEECLIDDEELTFDEKVGSYQTFLKYLNNKYNKGKYQIENLLSDDFKVIDTRQSDLRIYDKKTPTLRRGRHGILYVKDKKFRKLSGYESLLLQGFPKKYADIVKGKISNSKLLQQSGNAMTVNVIEEIGCNLMKAIGKNKMTDKEILINRGSLTAKNGFENEDFTIAEFNNWQISELAQLWLKAMNYDLKDIESVRASKVKGSYKADIQVEIKIEIKLKSLTDIQNLQVKLVSNPKGFNQIDKRWLKSYHELWNIPSDVYELLQHFTGEKSPKIPNPRDERRMFADEFSDDEQQLFLRFFNDNKTLIVNDILKGRGKFAAEWMLVILKSKENDIIQWALEPINKVLNHFGNGEISITPKGSFKIGNITIQRKGGDNGRPTANMLQFKINPAELVDGN